MEKPQFRNVSPYNVFLITACWRCVGAEDGQTIRVSVADREVFVTFRVRLLTFFSGRHFWFNLSA